MSGREFLLLSDEILKSRFNSSFIVKSLFRSAIFSHKGKSHSRREISSLFHPLDFGAFDSFNGIENCGIWHKCHTRPILIGFSQNFD
jgi:hypothetical protein